MAYKPTVWVEKQTPLSPHNLNKIEQGIAGSVPLGESNDEVALVKTLLVGVDTRQLHVTDWTPKGSPTAVELRDSDGVTVLASATITYNAKEKPTEAVVTYHIPDEANITVTHTLSWADLTRLLSWEKGVS